MNIGKECNSACYIWYIEGSQLKILVDAGATASMYEEKGIPETDLISVEDGLSRFGLKPTDIDVVIITHLHFDHIALGYLYKNAKFIVQKKEVNYARHPHPVDARYNDSKLFNDLNLEIIDGEKEIATGITVFTTPGHTPGGQSVEISTLRGKAVIPALCYLDNFEQSEEMKNRGWEVTPPSIHHDSSEAYDSLIKIKNRADIILPLHDPIFITKETI